MAKLKVGSVIRMNGVEILIDDVSPLTGIWGCDGAGKDYNITEENFEIIAV